jgi:hypothetical protein
LSRAFFLALREVEIKDGTAPALPVGYVVSARRIADRRMILAGYRLTDVLTQIVVN